jgi:hypothetical protein
MYLINVREMGTKRYDRGAWSADRGQGISYHERGKLALLNYWQVLDHAIKFIMILPLFGQYGMFCCEEGNKMSA